MSDPVAAKCSKIIEKTPCGHGGNHDKGFLVDNLCACYGVGCVRPQKKLSGQTQQSRYDTCNTMKVGNSRVVVEQCNGGAKQTGGYFHRPVPVTQFGLAGQIIRICFFLQNFRKPIIQGYDSEGVTQRPTRGAIRWYGKTDKGLSDFRGHVHLWGTETEIARFKELETMHAEKSSIEIGEMVLQENIVVKLREQHIQKLGPLLE